MVYEHTQLYGGVMTCIQTYFMCDVVVMSLTTARTSRTHFFLFPAYLACCLVYFLVIFSISRKTLPASVPVCSPSVDS